MQAEGMVHSGAWVLKKYKVVMGVREEAVHGWMLPWSLAPEQEIREELLVQERCIC